MADNPPPPPFVKRRRGGATKNSSMIAADNRSVHFADGHGYPAAAAATAESSPPGLTDEDTVDDDKGMAPSESDRKRPAQKSTVPTDDSPTKQQPASQKPKRPTPMDLAWRQVALDEKEGRIPEFVAETEAERKVEAISAKNKERLLLLRKIKDASKRGDYDEYHRLMDRLLSGSDLAAGDADGGKDDDSLSSIDSDDSNITRNSSGDKVWKGQVDPDTFLAGLFEEAKARRNAGRSAAAEEGVEVVEEDSAGAANLKRGDDDDGDDVICIDDIDGNSGDGQNVDEDGDNDGDEEEDDVPLKVWEKCQMIMNRRSNNKNSPSISSSEDIRLLLNCALRDYGEAGEFLSDSTLLQFKDIEDLWAGYADMLPKKRRDKSSFDSVSKKDCTECIAMAGGALTAEYAEESKPKIDRRKLKAGLSKLLVFYEECKKKVDVEEAAARRKSEAKARRATKATTTKAATAPSSSAGRGRPKTLAVLRTHKDRSTAYDFEARIHHPELVSDTIVVCCTVHDCCCIVAVLLHHRRASSPNISAPASFMILVVALPQFKVS